MGGSGWEWMGVGGSGWEWMGVDGSGWEWVGAQIGKARDKSTLNDPNSSCSEVFCKKGVLRNFAKFTRKYLCQSSRK